MCLRPINLYNQTYSLRPIDKTHFSVPCGTCEECINIRRNEYTFRIYQQMRKCFRDGWRVYFFTLTYDDDHMPLRSVYPNNEKLQIKCFRRTDIIKFFKRIRKHLLQKFGVKGIVYVCASEYGHSTKRPHYHCMLSLPSCIDQQYIFDYIHDIWINGFVFPRYLYGGMDLKGYVHKPFEVLERDCENASFYVAKYCCKDMAFYSLPEVDRFVKHCKKFISSSDIDEETYRYVKYMLYDCLTFVHTSRNFGLCINDLVTDPSQLYTGVESPFKDRLVPIPNYNRRKLLFHVRKVSEDPSIKVDSFDKFGNIVKKYKVRYDLTDFGKRAFSEYVRRGVRSMCDLLTDFKNLCCGTEDFEMWQKDNGFNFNDQLFEDHIRDISVYAVVYQNRCSPLHLQQFYDFPHIYNKKFRVIPCSSSYYNAGLTWTQSDSSYRFSGSESLSYMIASAESFYVSQLSFDRYLNEGLVNVKEVKDLDSVHFNSFPCFLGFDNILHIVFSYLVFMRSDKVKAKFYENLEKQIYKQSISEF